MNPADKATLSERDICTKFITPAIAAASWNTHSQMREEVNLTDARAVQARLASALVAEFADTVAA